jgi:hypothetical protein
METVEHACPARQHARDRFPPNLNLAEAWLSPELLKIIGDSIIDGVRTTKKKLVKRGSADRKHGSISYIPTNE